MLAPRWAPSGEFSRVRGGIVGGEEGWRGRRVDMVGGGEVGSANVKEGLARGWVSARRGYLGGALSWTWSVGGWWRRQSTRRARMVAGKC